jgi:hypothetical protein
MPTLSIEAMTRIALSACALVMAATACSKDAQQAESPEPMPGDEEPTMGAPASDTLDSGMPCVTADVVCDGGMCSATLKNACDGAATCELTMYAVCEGSTDVGEARGSNRGTFAAGSTGTLEAGANCEGASIMATQADQLSCR